MITTRRRFLTLAGAAAALPAMPHVARVDLARAEAAYPDHPVHWIVGQAAGSSSDITARLIGQFLSEKLGQQFIIEARPGAAGNIATEFVTRAPADGYTLLLANAQNTINAALYEKLNFDFLRDIAPIGGIDLVPLVMEVNPSVPAKTVAEFIAYAKAHPGKLNYGAGLGTPPHLLSTLFKTQAGLEVTYVPYKGSAPSVTDLLAGQTQFTIDGMLILMPQVKQGKLRALAVARGERWPALPDVPSLAESGFPDFVVDAWTGVVAPRGTPPQIIGRLNAAINAGLKTPEMTTALDRFSALPKGGTPEEFGALLQQELPKWAAMVKLSGAKGE